MRKVFLTLFLVLFFALPLFAQSVDTAWVRRYNGPGNSSDRAHDISVDGSGNVYVTGYSVGSGTNGDYATLKYDPAGNQLWGKRYNGPGNSYDYALAIAVDGSGNIYVTGRSVQTSSYPYYYDYATIKYYSNGDTAWVRRYNGPENYDDWAWAITVDGSGNIYVTGESAQNSSYPYNYDYATIKYYPNGDTAWVRRYNGPGNLDDKPYAIDVDSSGNVYVTGVSADSGYQEYDYATIKYNPKGDTTWVRRYNSPEDEWDQATAIAVDDSGYIYVTGFSSGDYCTIKYNPNGDTIWIKRYDGPANADDKVSDIAVDGASNVYVTGNSDGIGTDEDYATVKYYPSGDTAWVRRYNGLGNLDDKPYAIDVDSSGNVYVTGRSFGSGTSYDYATLKYYANGDTAWLRRYNGPGNSGDDACAIAVDGAGNVYVTGYSVGSGTYDDYATIKYIQFLRGDANSDKKVSLSDIVYLINYLFKFGPAPEPIQSGDTNCDGKVSLGDIVYLINYLFKFGPAPCI
jgi:uncharacterized delta-60 repeat protein